MKRVLESALHTLGELLELDTGWASHLAMLEPLSGREHIESAYDAALAAKYLWHEFGDVHLLMPERRLDG